MAASDVSLVQDTFGRILGEEVQRFTFSNSDGFSFQVINFGAIITSILVPDARGVGTDVVLGFDTAEDWATNDGEIGAIFLVGWGSMGANQGPLLSRRKGGVSVFIKAPSSDMNDYTTPPFATKTTSGTRENSACSEPSGMTL
uniref:Galactose mutarotase n=1 Tax=Timema tahoe TaxID=61484 RepID=A0A7R9IJT8_9NEOP|nr:unnamed protein product [Timema tahoe]